MLLGEGLNKLPLCRRSSVATPIPRCRPAPLSRSTSGLTAVVLHVILKSVKYVSWSKHPEPAYRSIDLEIYLYISLYLWDVCTCMGGDGHGG